MIKYPNICTKEFQKKLNTKLNLTEQLSCKVNEQTNSKNTPHLKKKSSIYKRIFNNKS